MRQWSKAPNCGRHLLAVCSRNCEVTSPLIIPGMRIINWGESGTKDLRGMCHLLVDQRNFHPCLRLDIYLYTHSDAHIKKVSYFLEYTFAQKNLKEICHLTYLCKQLYPSNQWVYASLPLENFPGPFRRMSPANQLGTCPVKVQSTCWFKWNYTSWVDETNFG